MYKLHSGSYVSVGLLCDVAQRQVAIWKLIDIFSGHRKHYLNTRLY